MLTHPVEFELPYDVSRRRIRRADGSRKATPPLLPAAVAVGRQTLVDELSAAEPSFNGPGLDTLVFLREPIARSTTAALVPEADLASRNQIAGLVLAWIDALAPVISAARSPRRWSRPRRAEQLARRSLIQALANLGCEDAPARATTLAAGIQVPIAAGAWCLTQLACRPALRRRVLGDPSLALPFVWEILRLYPPTWVLPRISTRDFVLGETPIPPYTPVLVSPVALGRLPELVPGPDSGCSLPRRARPRPLEPRRTPPRGLAAVRGRPARLPGPEPGPCPAHPAGLLGERLRADLARSTGCRHQPRPVPRPVPHLGPAAAGSAIVGMDRSPNLAPATPRLRPMSEHSRRSGSRRPATGVRGRRRVRPDRCLGHRVPQRWRHVADAVEQVVLLLSSYPGVDAVAASLTQLEPEDTSELGPARRAGLAPRVGTLRELCSVAPRRRRRARAGLSLPWLSQLARRDVIAVLDTRLLPAGSRAGRPRALRHSGCEPWCPGPSCATGSCSAAGPGPRDTWHLARRAHRRPSDC